MKKSLKKLKIFVGNLGFDTKIDYVYQLLGLRSTKYLRETCKINVPVNEKMGKCRGFTFVAQTCAKQNS